MSIKEYDGKMVLSVERSANKLKISPHNYDMDKTQKERFWKPIVDKVDSVRHISDESIRRAQYMQYRFDILKQFRSAINVRGA